MKKRQPLDRMVLTRMSHFGEQCPLRDHSYSDPAAPSISTSSVAAGHTHHSKRVLIGGGKGNQSSNIIIQHFHIGDCDEIHIFDLPNEIFEKIFSYIPYKKIGEIRLTCRRFEQIGSNLLNSTFQRLQNQMLQRFQTIKGQMPRRESARRTHPLARESDIVETLHMRLTLLQMSFGKHIERKHCCFFAGDILDEVYRLLTYIKNTPNLDRAYIVTDELFDLSTMAMEYFKENIEPRLPEITCFGSEFLDITSRFSEECSGVRSPCGSGRASEPEDDIPEHETLPQSNMVLRKRIKRIRQGMRRYNSQLAAMKRELKSCKGKLNDQHKQTLEYTTRMDEYDKKFEESSRKFSTVLQELNKCKTELQYWRSKSPAHPLLCYNCGQSVGEGPGQQLPAGVLMQGVEDGVVYVPLAPAPSPPECVEKVTPPVLFAAARDDSRDKWLTMGGSVRNLERMFDLDHRSSNNPVRSASEPPLPQPSHHYHHHHHHPLPLPPPPPPPTISPFVHPPSPHSPILHSISSAQPSTIEITQSIVSCPVVAATSNSILTNAAQPLPISQPMVGTSTITTSHTCAALPVISTAPPPIMTSQPYSAFHSCISSHTSDHRWYSSQEHAEDLSMSRPNKQHYLDEQDTYFNSLKRRSSDDESDNCDNDDTVGRRVKERKRIKLDVF